MLRFFIAVVLSFFLFLKSPAGIFASQDWEYWSKYSLEVALGKKAGFYLEPEFKFKHNFKEYYYSKTYLGLSYKPNKLIEVRGYYAYKTKKDKTDWKEADLLYLDPILKFDLQHINFNNRFRLEYDLDKKELVYQNRLKIKKSFYDTITPFIQEEIFYSFSSGQCIENRFSVGLSVTVLKDVGFSGEYMLNSKKVSSFWQNSNVLVTTLSFAL
ncbi:MAG: DUF2490 domain-containing protein [candidate division Zixibacteria bacterium]|nr:DUF2490 domain-containing protein [candidate division Zixibacteria bacterium]